MSRRLTWATYGTGGSTPMGLQNYERELISQLGDVSDGTWEYATRAVANLRSREPGAARLPLRALERGPASLARALGRIAYRGADRVHRFDLRLPPAHVPEVVTIHDIAPLRFDDEGTLPAWSITTARRARLAICASEFAANELRDGLGLDRIAIVPHGIAEEFRTARAFDAGERADAGLPDHYVLAVGGHTKRKNLAALAEAWTLAAPRIAHVDLVLAGPAAPARARIFAGCPRVVASGYRPRPQMPGVVASALVLVIPSTYEGFGLPALEAMAAGVPVIAANASSLPEVCGDAAVLVRPRPEAIADALVKVCRDASLRRELAARGRARAEQFSWRKAALGHVRAYNQAFS